MNNLKYKGILYFITCVILATLCIQGYWNYKNYQIGKQQLLNDVQTSLDNAVDAYYTQLAAQTSFEMIGQDVHLSKWINGISSSTFNDTLKHENIISKADGSSKGLTILKSRFRDSSGIDITFSDSLAKEAKFFTFQDSLTNPIETLSSKIIVSFTQDGLSLHKIDSLFAIELNRKNIALEYGLTDSGFTGKLESIRPEIVDKATLKTSTKSPYFFHGNVLIAHFSNITLSVLQRNMLGMVLSFILVSGVIACLLYLLKIIQHQKQLAEVKNDLIGNITHEFKTPIATIGVALEGIQNFNSEHPSEKTMRYTQISREQVGKLNMMVEKLLETASLDSDRLALKMESEDLVRLLERVTQNEGFLHHQKRINFSSNVAKLSYPLDVFHFENALNNIVDNAVKYGGDQIEVALHKKASSLEISVSDNGNSLNEVHKKQLFEKFYRVQKGNTHDVKGFGIGLFYTKKIIEKHKGSIRLEPQPFTTFRITLPYEGTD